MAPQDGHKRPKISTRAPQPPKGPKESTSRFPMSHKSAPRGRAPSLPLRGADRADPPIGSD
eukprot:690226-Pyramimonas_sp.AAC.1